MNMLAWFLSPVALGKTAQMLLLLPLCLTISIVYKTTKIEDVRQIPLASIVSFITIVIGMYAVGIALLLVYEWMA